MEILYGFIGALAIAAISVVIGRLTKKSEGCNANSKVRGRHEEQLRGHGEDIVRIETQMETQRKENREDHQGIFRKLETILNAVRKP